MKLTKNFTVEELTKSDIAARKNIDNTPDKKSMANLTELAETVLQPIRDAWKKPIVVNSGFRCYRLNRAERGAQYSDHRYGAAADIHTHTNYPKDNEKLFNLIVKLAEEGKISCRQIIDEYDYKWIHVSINHAEKEHQHNQILHLNN